MPAALAVSALAAAWAWHTQVFQVFRYWDSDEYFLMAQQIAAGERITAAAPYAYRVLTPWMVATCCAGDIQRGFLVVNLAAGVLMSALLVWWLRPFVASAGVRLLMVAAYAWQWHGPIRFTFYYPAYVDPVFQAFVLAALIACERLVARPTAAAGAGFVGLSALGAFARETMLIAPTAALFGSLVARPRWAAAAAGWMRTALLATLAALVGARFLATPRPGYGAVEAALMHIATKPVESIVLVWFIAFGPMVAFIAYDWRATLGFLRRRPDLAAWPVVCIALAYVGGHDTERYLFWAMPVMYLLVAQSIERHARIVSSTAVASVAVVGQLLSERVLWPVPDPGSAVTALSSVQGVGARIYAVANRVFVIDDFHWNLWSNFGSRPFHLVQLAFYLAVSAALLLLMQRRASRAVAPA